MTSSETSSCCAMADRRLAAALRVADDVEAMSRAAADDVVSAVSQQAGDRKAKVLVEQELHPRSSRSRSPRPARGFFSRN